MSPAVHDGAWVELITVLARSVAHLPAGVDLAQAGATVIAPGLAEDRDYLRSLGVAEVLDRNGDIPAQVRERHSDLVDALLDLTSQSPDRLNTYAAVVRDGGPIGSSLGAAGEGPGRANISAVPTADQLDRLAGLLADGTLTVPIQASYPMAQADHALKALTGQHSQGELAITPPTCHQPTGPTDRGPVRSLSGTIRASTSRRIAQGKSQREIRRCLKRTVGRQLYRLLERTATNPASS